MKYYLMNPDGQREIGVCRAPAGVESQLVHSSGVVEKWQPVRMVVEGGVLTDYPPNNLGWPIVSPAMKDCIAGHMGKRDMVAWLEVSVAVGQRSLPYCVVLFLDRPDVLNRERTVFGPRNILIKPVLDESKLQGRRIFALPGNVFRVMVSEDMKVALASFEYLRFERVPVSVQPKAGQP